MREADAAQPEIYRTRSSVTLSDTRTVIDSPPDNTPAPPMPDVPAKYRQGTREQAEYKFRVEIHRLRMQVAKLEDAQSSTEGRM